MTERPKAERTPLQECPTNEKLNDQCFRKLVIWENGAVEVTTAPPKVYIRTMARHWQLGDGLMLSYRGWCIGENRPPVNLWWEQLREVVPDAPLMYGALVLWRWGALEWDAALCTVELLNFLVNRYQRSHPYHFSDFSRRSVTE